MLFYSRLQEYINKPIITYNNIVFYLVVQVQHFCALILLITLGGIIV